MRAGCERRTERPEAPPLWADFFAARIRVKGLLIAAGVMVVLLSLAGFAGRFWWALDLASHFRVQYFVILAGLTAALLLCRAYRPALLFAVVACLNGAMILPLYAAVIPDPPAPAARVLRAMQINVQMVNTDHAAVLASIRAADPDFVVLVEVDGRWTAGLGALADDYPHAIEHPRGDAFGIALYSKHPLTSAEIVRYGAPGMPSVLAQVELGGRRFHLLGTHPLPPLGPAAARNRDAQLAATAEAVRALGHPVLLIGDLNVSPWSFHFRRLLRHSGLRDGTRGRGFQPTWPAGLPPLLIPIDHSLHSPGIQVIDRVVGEDVGSDHYPLVVDFVVSEPKG